MINDHPQLCRLRQIYQVSVLTVDRLYLDWAGQENSRELAGCPEQTKQATKLVSSGVISIISCLSSIVPHHSVFTEVIVEVGRL